LSKEKKNTLLYTLNNVDAPAMNLEYSWQDIKTSRGFQNVLYSHPQYYVGKLKKDCSKVQGEKFLAELEKREGVTLLMPPDLWCVENLKHKFNIIIGEVVKRKINVGGVSSEPYAYVRYHISEDDTYPADFQWDKEGMKSK